MGDENKSEKIVITTKYPLYTAIQCSECGCYVLGEGKIVNEGDFICIHCRVKHRKEEDSKSALISLTNKSLSGEMPCGEIPRGETFS